jgi:hypothetical protein
MANEGHIPILQGQQQGLSSKALGFRGLLALAPNRSALQDLLGEAEGVDEPGEVK